MRKTVMRTLPFKAEVVNIQRARVEMPQDAQILDIRFSSGSWEIWTMESDNDMLMGPVEVVKVKEAAPIPDSLILPPFFKSYTHQSESIIYHLFLGNAY